MNVFIYYGNIKDPNSKSFDFILKLVEYFKKDSYYNDIVLRTADNVDFKFMNTWKDLINNDSSSDRCIIEKELLNADLIIIASPVFLHNVTAYTKLFLDNYAHWAHTMPLIGKLGIPISLSSSNGNTYVNNYIEKIMNYWGIITLDPVSIELSNLNSEAIMSYIRFLYSNSKISLEDILSIDYKQMDEIYKLNYNNMMQYKDDHFEKIIFNNLGYINLDTFEKALRYKITKRDDRLN